jgi:hypothetical protein
VQLGSDAYEDEPLAPPPEKEEKKGGGLFIVLALVAVVVLGLGGAWATGLFGGGDPDPEPVAAAEPAPEPAPAPAPPPAPEPAPAPTADPVDDGALAGAEPGDEPPAVEDPEPAVAAAAAPRDGGGATASRPDPAPAPAEPKKDDPWAQPAKKDDAVADAGGPWGSAQKGKRTGRLTVTTSPAGARVLVDGKAVGTAPWSGAVAYGNHNVKAELEGHKAAARNVELGTSQLDLNFTLRPVVVTGQVNIYGTPQAKVFIDGNPVGEIPVTALLSEGPHQFEVVTADGQRFTRKYDIKFSVPGVPVTITLIAQ